MTAGPPPEQKPGADRPQRQLPTLLEQMGGVQGIVASTIPVAVFVVVNLLSTLQAALIAALAAGVAIAIWRVARKQALQPAVSGSFAVGVAAFIAYRTGEARAFYLPGLLFSAALGLAFLVSVLVRWPLAGVIWHGINGDGQSWRRDRRLLRAYTLASLLWTLVFVARAGGAGPALQRRRGDLARRRPAGDGLPARRCRTARHALGGAPRPPRPGTLHDLTDPRRLRQ